MAFHVFGEGAEHGQNRLRAIFWHHAIFGEHAFAGGQGFYVAFRVAHHEVFGHFSGDLFGAVVMDVMQCFHEGIGQFLNLLFVGGHPIRLHIERGGRVCATQRCARCLHGAHINQWHGHALLNQAGDGGFSGHASLDFVLFHGSDESVTSANGN